MPTMTTRPATRKLGTTIAVQPGIVRLDVPLRDARDLAHIGKELEALGHQLRALHEAEHLNENGKLFDAYLAVRSLNRKLKKEYPQ